ncbi:G-protein coupled receptor Mth2-like isoform X3 [Galleria mellonella]|uniref:G-protein coupled receptor Mth2-like isoform X3 n=1 Tax=Galleria mellonella TaxID=7137 RepID=A0A6J3BZW3_GALME|nr:G-protein coupled receptor Mth2-like isoform X3 [Galleria mellonella]
MLAAVTIVTVFIGSTIAFGLDVCDVKNSVDLSSGTRMSNGDIHFNGIQYEEKDYYFDNITGVERGCICSKQLCIRKCCPHGQAFDINKKVCTDTAAAFDPPIWNSHKVLQGVKAAELFHYVYGTPICVNDTVRIRVKKITNNIHLKNDGRLFIELSNSIPPYTLREPDKYCIDTFVSEDVNGVKKSQVDALVCFADEAGGHHYALSSSCMLISCVFILATVGVYAWLPELRNLHGRVLMAYLLCLFVAFAFMATMQILLPLKIITRPYCIAMTFIIYFSLESAFFWLNVMCFDIWWTFSGKRGISFEKLSTKARFYAYALYAFGIPTALTILLAALEFSDLPLHPLLPQLRQQGCFIYGNGRLIYLYGPLVVLCTANLIFFILTAVKIAQIKKQTSVLKSKESSTHDSQRNDKQRLFLYIKLFIVMGVNWLLEVISALYPELDNFWRFTDAYNVLIGLIIFIIFVCKRKIFRLIKKRYKQLRGEPMSRTQTTMSSRTASTKDDMQMNSIKFHSK